MCGRVGKLVGKWRAAVMCKRERGGGVEQWIGSVRGEECVSEKVEGELQMHTTTGSD